MEENRRFSWSDLFIKVILVIIFVLFTVWLLSLSNRKMSNSLDVLTDKIFVENMEKMKEVGKSYFTTERLPEKVGEIEILTLEKMYEKKLLLELKDKNGNSCSADNSYVSIEKFDTEYQMKVFLECGKESDYIIVIMGCYDYCDTDICEKQDNVEEEEYVKGETAVEYQYKKTTNGKWTEYGSWSEWSKVSVTKTDYRQVETKKVNEDYTYDKTVTETLFEEVGAVCPDGFKLTTDGTRCYKENVTNKYEDPTCPAKDGYSVVRNGFTCTYTKTDILTEELTCPSGYKLSDDGTKCTYTKTTTSTTDPVCPSKSGWTYSSRDGFTCYYGQYVKVYDKKLVTKCPTGGGGCNKVWENIYVRTDYHKTSGSASCPSGYSRSGNTCVKYSTTTDTKVATCNAGYTNVNGICTKGTVDTKIENAVCSTGFSHSGNKCVKPVTSYGYEKIVKTCPVDYKLTSDGTKCFKDVEKTVSVTEKREVTYYRYRIREYVNGTTDYKWSTSKNDKKLLDAGYKLTGKTR